jgi:8-oxo-dGTP diphosphatase
VTHVHIPGVWRPKFCALCSQGLEERVIKNGEPARLVCCGCGEVSWLDAKVSVGVLIEWNGGLLVLRRANEPGVGKWVFPGGFVDRGEVVTQAAIREAREEALIEVGDLELQQVYSYDSHPVILIAYRARILSGTPGAGDEALDVASFPLNAMPFDELAFRSTKDAVADWLAWRAKR